MGMAAVSGKVCDLWCGHRFDLAGFPPHAHRIYQLYTIGYGRILQRIVPANLSLQIVDHVWGLARNGIPYPARLRIPCCASDNTATRLHISSRRHRRDVAGFPSPGQGGFLSYFPEFNLDRLVFRIDLGKI